MSYFTVLGIFDHIDNTADAVKPIEAMPLPHDDMKILSVAPYPDGTFFRDDTPSPIWLFALIFGIVGLLFGFALAGYTQVLMNLDVGGKPPLSLPVVGVISYETSLLGAVIGTFVGMLWMIGLPNWTPRAYDADISRGKIGLLVRCFEEEKVTKLEEIMNSHGAAKIIKGVDDF